jgi:hypothetical protein
MQESRVAGEVLFDGGQVERRVKRGDGERAREEDEQRMSSKNGSSTSERAKSKQYTAARQDRNQRRRKEKKRKKAEKKRHKQPSDFVACVPESEKNDMCDDVLSYKSDERDCKTVLPELKAQCNSDESDIEMPDTEKMPVSLRIYESSHSKGEKEE